MTNVERDLSSGIWGLDHAPYTQGHWKTWQASHAGRSLLHLIWRRPGQKRKSCRRMLGKGRAFTTNLSLPARFTVHHYNGVVISQGCSQDAGGTAQPVLTFSWFIAHPPRR